MLNYKAERMIKYEGYLTRLAQEFYDLPFPGIGMGLGGRITYDFIKHLRHFHVWCRYTNQELVAWLMNPKCRDTELIGRSY